MSEQQSLRDWMGRDKGQIALVFTDIVSSTKIASKIGDDRWIKLLKKHFERARFYKRQHDAYEVKLIGDACMIAFHTAWPALQFALDFFADPGGPRPPKVPSVFHISENPPINIKAGIHIGVVQVVDNDMYGSMVNYTARVVKAAGGPSGLGGVVISKAALQQVNAVLGTETAEIELVVTNLQHQALEEFSPMERELYWISRRDVWAAILGEEP